MIILTLYQLYKVKNFQDGSAPFQTFSVHRQLDNGEQVIKIFSSHELGEEELDDLFLNKSWTFRKKWHAFPELYPITDEHQFVPFVLKMEGEENGIIYTSAFENFISVRYLYTRTCVDIMTNESFIFKDDGNANDSR